MFVKLTKRMKTFNANEYFRGNQDLSVIEILTKNPSTISIDLNEFQNLKKLYIYTQGDSKAEISGASRLEILKLKGMTNCHELKTQNHPDLKTLQLSKCTLHSLPKWVCRLEKLETLEIQNNQLAQLPIEFEWLRQIKRLNIDGNEFEEVPRVLANLDDLNHLSCDGNKITQRQIEDFRKLLHS